MSRVSNNRYQLITCEDNVAAILVILSTLLPVYNWKLVCFQLLMWLSCDVAPSWHIHIGLA